MCLESVVVAGGSQAVMICLETAIAVCFGVQFGFFLFGAVGVGERIAL